MRIKEVVQRFSFFLLAAGLCSSTWARELPDSDFRATMITMTRGTVISIDKAAKKITLSHQGNYDLEIPAAKTTFDLKSADMANNLAVGAAVFFVAAGDAKKPELIRLEPRRPNGFTY